MPLIGFGLVGSEVGEGNPLPLPAGAAAGDFVLILNWGRGTSSPPTNDPDRFEGCEILHTNTGTNNERVTFAARILDGTETIAAKGLAVLNKQRYCVLLLRPAFSGGGPLTSFAGRSCTSEFTSNTPATQVIPLSTNTEGLALTFGIKALVNVGAVDPHTASGLAEFSYDTSFYAHAGVLFNPSMSNYNYSMTDDGQNILASGYLIFNNLTDYTLACNVGTFGLTGQSAIVNKGKTIYADATAFAMTGVDAVFRIVAKVAAETGVFVFDGLDQIINAGKTIVAALGTFAFTGRAALFGTGRGVMAQTGAFVVSVGVDPLITWVNRIQHQTVGRLREKLTSIRRRNRV